MKRKDIEDIYKEYGRKIDQSVDTSNEPSLSRGEFSKEYRRFKKEMMPKLSRYESLCRSLGSIIKLKIAEEDRDKIQKELDRTHLDVTPSQSVTLAIIASLLSFFMGVLFTVAIYLLSGSFPFIFLFLVIIASLFFLYYFYQMPSQLANNWRLKASSQMVPAVLYVVAYMKHTSNLERAVQFAAEHLEPPLALDLRKVFWDVETGKYSRVQESLDTYLETWRETNPEFIEAFHLIESSLYEPGEDRRVEILEKGLQVILDGVYDKMLKYSREIRSPLTNLYMLGIVLPTLGIALLPLASTLLGGAIKWYHVFVLFNLIIPFFVFYMTNKVLMKRPGGHGEKETLERNPHYQEFKSNKPYLVAIFLVLPFIIIGLLPFIFQYTPLPQWIGLSKDYTFAQLGLEFFDKAKFFGFINGKGPFGLGAILASLFLPFGIALFFSYAYMKKSKTLMKARRKTKKLESEFTNSLFQLGNRLANGIPAEIAFSKVASSTKGEMTEGFFNTVNTNIRQLGMSVEDAIFNKNRGAIIYYPSSLISTSMKILVESVKRGLKVAARSLMSISQYIKNINKINERLKDLLAEVVSDMKSNMTFLAPLLAGIVVGLSSMITMILSKLEVMIGEQGVSGQGLAGVGSIGSITELFQLTQMIPPYYLQLAIGIYIIEITFILSSALVTVDAGQDKLGKIYETGKNLRRGILIYSTVALISILALSLLASIAIGGM